MIRHSADNAKPPLGAEPDLTHPQMRGLELWWAMPMPAPFVPDWSMHGRTGSIVGTPIDWRPGVTGGYALQANGNANCRGVTGGPDLDDYFPNFSFGGWFMKTADGESSNTIICGTDNGGWDYAFRTGTSGDGVSLHTGTSGGFGAGFTFTRFEWAHIFAVFDAADCRAYVNGKPANTRGSAPDATNGGLMTFGGKATSTINGQNFVGRADDLRVYSRALTPSEVREIYLDPWAPFRRRELVFVEPAAAAAAHGNLLLLGVG